MKWKPAVVLLAVCLPLVAACSDDRTAPSPTIGSDSAAPASPSEEPRGTPSEPPAHEATFDDQGHVAMAGDVRAAGARQRQVVDAWLDYWQVRMDAFAVPEVDPVALGRVAQGDAASQVVSYVDYLTKSHLRTDGDLRFDVSRVRVRGDRAVLQTCVTNRSIDRHGDGRAAEPLTPFYEFQGHLSRADDAWAVTRVIDTGSGPC